MIGVVGHAVAHQIGAQVRVAEAQLAEGPSRVADALGRVVGVAHHDLLAGEDHRHRGLEPVHIELVLIVEEGEQVHGGQIAGRVVEVNIF